MKTVTTRTLAALLCAAGLFAQGERKPETPAALVEQALYAEEHQRDFTRAAELFQRALDAARQANDATQLERARKGLDRVVARQRGAGVEQDDPILCAISRCLDAMESSSTQPESSADAAENDIQLYGAFAVPWIEKAIAGPLLLCDTNVSANVDRCVRVLTRMRIPEADAALQRLLKSIDPLARRAVATYCDPDAQRAILQQALSDPTPTVRDAAVKRFLRSSDPTLAASLLPHARAGNVPALEWLSRHQAAALVTIATDPRADHRTRAVALGQIERSTLPQDSAHVDALLALARDSSVPQLAKLAMTALADLLAKWRPLEPSIAEQVRLALTAAPGAYPQPGAALALLGTGGGPAIAASAVQLLAALEAMPAQSNEQHQLCRRLDEQLMQLGGDAFPHVVEAYRELPIRIGSGDFRDQMLDSYARALRRLAPSAASPDLARCATGLAGDKFAFYASVVVQALRTSLSSQARVGARLEPEWLPLLRRMATSAEENVRESAVSGLGALGDPSVLPDLMAALKDSSPAVAARASEALRNTIRADPARSRRVLEDAMGAFLKQHGKHSAELAGQLAELPADDALELAERYWDESRDVWVHDTLARVVCDHVPGQRGLEFLLSKLPEMAAGPAYTRQRVIQRFGNELYEPALDALERALSDPSAEVRASARAAFKSFKEQREALAEFAAWKATRAEARQTVDELLELTASPNVEVVVGAVKALGALKASAAYPKLVRLLERKEPEIKAAVQAALDKLGE